MVTCLHVGFKVKDYAQWKAGFDAHIEPRKAAGEKSFQVFRNVDDPNTITVLTTHEDPAQVQAYMSSPELKAAMEQAGVIEMGPVLIVEQMDSATN